LSLITHAWVLARSDREHSWHLFSRALDSDIEDIQGGTTPEGIHTGAMAGTVDLVQRNYLGLETRAGVLHFNPTLPVDVECLQVRLRYRRHRLDVTATQTSLVVHSRPEVAPMIEVAYRSHIRKLNPGDSQEFRLIRPEERSRGNKAVEQLAAAD
jgi:alpha,alpha-trehalase